MISSISKVFHVTHPTVIDPFENNYFRVKTKIYQIVKNKNEMINSYMVKLVLRLIYWFISRR